MRKNPVVVLSWAALPVWLIAFSFVGGHSPSWLSGSADGSYEHEGIARLIVTTGNGVEALDIDSLENVAATGGEHPAGDFATASGVGGTLWVGTRTELKLLGAADQPIARIDPLDAVRALGSDPAEQLLWSVEDSTLVKRDLVNGALLGTTPLDPVIGTVELAVTPRSGPIWVATSDWTALVDPDQESRVLSDLTGLTHLEANGSGGAWGLLDGDLVSLQWNGEWFLMPLPAQIAKRRWSDLESRSHVVWLTDGASLVRFDVESGDTVVRESELEVEAIGLSLSDLTPPALEWRVPEESPTPGAQVEIDLRVEEFGAGVAGESIELLVNGEAVVDGCRGAARSSYRCTVPAHYVAGRMLLLARARDRAGNYSTALSHAWSESRTARSSTVEATLASDGDSYVRSHLPSNNFGHLQILGLQLTNEYRPFVRFDLASVATDIATLYSATLELYVTGNGNNWGAGGQVGVFRMTTPWTESGATWLCPDDTDTTNADPDCPTQWWGGDHAATPTDSVLHTNDLSGWVSFDVTADVQLFLDGQDSGSGWALVRTTSGYGWVVYASRQRPGGNPPTLRLVYDPVGTDTTPPTLSFTAPADGALLADGLPQLDFAYADDGSGVDVTTLAVLVNGSPVGVSCTPATATASCQLLAPLPEGPVMLSATVEDEAGNVSPPTLITVTIDTIAPSLVDISLTSAAEPASGASLVTGLAGAAEAGTTVTATNIATAAQAATVALADGSFGVSIAAEGNDALGLVSTDTAGNASPQTIVFVPVAEDELPPDPTTKAGPVDPTVPTSFYEATRFLWEGDPPIQWGVTPGAIDPLRASVLRGRVLDGSGAPLSGVTITIAGHPELGETLSRLDGAFDLAVNGGGHLAVNYRKAGHVSSQRRVEPPWLDYLRVDDVRLLRLDSATTMVTSGGASPQVARGNPMTDAAGTRRATLMFKAATQAEAVLSDGSTVDLPSLTVRATEYTVGDGGPEAMPGPLPAASGYTYAMELSVDEALALGAEDVVFDRPVSFYVENFLEFPAGSIVPVGYYDRALAAWVGSDNGIVLGVLSIVAGLAELDVDGSGTPADVAALAALGIDDAERETIAGLYLPGESIWRVPVTHFSPWDCNWPYGPPDDAEKPPDLDEDDNSNDDADDSDPEDNDDDADDEEDPDCTGGSIIECQNQTLRESLDIPGTPYSLHYSSARVPGRKAARTAKILLSEGTVPASLKRIELEIDVAGQEHRLTFASAPDQTYSFEWDGKDAYGRALSGRHTATIRVGYVYDAVFYESTDDLVKAWARYSSAATVPTDANRSEFVLWRTTTRKLLGYDNTHDVVGGWSIDVHHRYDTDDNELLLGDGTTRGRGTTAARTTRRWAGSEAGTAGYRGDGGPARDAWLFFPLGIDAGPDGSVYVADWQNHRLRRIGPDGIIETVAGDGSAASGGDGGPATAAQIDEVYEVAVAPDGTLFIACAGSSGLRVRKVDPAGIISTVLSGLPVSSMDVGPDGTLYFTANGFNQVLRLDPEGGFTVVAGTGNAGWDGDGGPALQANLGGITDVVVDSREWVYVGSTAHASVRVITPDGIIAPFAGNGQVATTGDGGPATEAGLELANLAIGPDDSLYVHQTRRVRHIDSNGIISSQVIRVEDGVVLDGDPATAARFGSITSDMAVSPDGILYLSDRYQSGIGRINPLLPGTSLGDFFVASDDGRELYFFDQSGRHLRTIHALTGAVLLDFAYDASGRLLSITDADNLVTLVERDGAGAAQAIEGPYGHRMELELDAQGYLSSVTAPGPLQHLFAYSTDGLLETAINPRGYQTTYGYSPTGRLVSAEDAVGGVKGLSRRVSGDDYQVTLTSRAGTETRYRVTHLSDGNERRRRISPAGHVTETLIETDGTTTTTSPDGTVQVEVQGPEPRFGMQAPITESLSVGLPSGLTRATTHSRATQLTDPANPLSLETVTDTFVVNGRSSTSLYDASLRTTTTTSPEGRVATMVFDEQGRPIELSDGTSEPLRITYDEAGRPESLSQGQGAEEWVASLSYDTEGSIASFTDAEQRTSSFQYDTAGRVERKTEPDDRIVDYSHDANGNLTSVTPPGRGAHGLDYDPVDLLSRYSPPELGGEPLDTLYHYNLDRQLDERLEAAGAVMDPVIDGSGRLASVVVPEGTYVFTYDPSSGQLAQITTPGGDVVSYSYDGFLLTATTWSGAVYGSVSRVYDSDFRTATRSVNGSHSVVFGYDDDGLLLTAGQLQVARDPASHRVDGTTLGLVTTSRSYNAFGEIESASTSVAGTEVFAVSFVRDKIGRIRQKTETIEGSTATFDYLYDLAGRLIRVDRDGTVYSEYTYDDNGNRLTYDGPFGSVAATYDAQDRLVTYGGATFAFDPSGRLESKSAGGFTVSYDYDVLGNLRAVDLENGIQIEYVLDGQNRRTGKEINGVLVKGFLYKDLLNPVAELDGTGAVTARFIYGTRANVPDYMEKDGVVYRILGDQNGSPRLVVDTATGTIAQRMDYDEFGRVVFDSNPGFQPFGFAGGLYDGQTGLVRFGARDYDPEVGRWTAKDPILFAGGSTNLYGYALLDPINLVDLEGRGVKPFSPSPTRIQEWLKNFCFGEQVGRDASEEENGAWSDDTYNDYFEEEEGCPREVRPAKPDMDDIQDWCEKYDVDQRDKEKSGPEEIDSFWEKTLYWAIHGEWIGDAGDGAPGD